MLNPLESIPSNEFFVKVKVKGVAKAIGISLEGFKGGDDDGRDK